MAGVSHGSPVPLQSTPKSWQVLSLDPVVLLELLLEPLELPELPELPELSFEFWVASIPSGLLSLTH